jgi:DNA-binding GntR family transcriptional regulator
MKPVALVTASVAEQAVEALRNAIVRGELKAGKRYTTDDLAQAYGVSRTPVREALVRLSEAGFVAVEPKVGFRVIKPSVRDVQQLFQMRLMLEVPATYHAARQNTPIDLEALEGEFRAMDEIAKARAEAPASSDAESRELDLRYVDVDTRFHERILEASGNGRLVLEVRKLRHNTSALGVWRLSESRRDQEGRLEKGLLAMQKEHKALLDAMKEHDQVGAAHAMYAHLLKTGTLLMEELEKDDEGTFDRGWFEGVAVPGR